MCHRYDHYCHCGEMVDMDDDGYCEFCNCVDGETCEMVAPRSYRPYYPPRLKVLSAHASN